MIQDSVVWQGTLFDSCHAEGPLVVGQSHAGARTSSEGRCAIWGTMEADMLLFLRVPLLSFNVFLSA